MEDAQRLIFNTILKQLDCVFRRFTNTLNLSCVATATLFPNLKVMKYIILSVCAVFLISCGATVSYDYDKETDFSKYTSYNYFPVMESGMSPLDDQRIIKVTDSLLQERGFVKSENPQFFINFYSKEFTSASRNTIGIGVGGGGRNTGIGVSGGIPIGGRQVNQQLTMDFIDATRDALFWQALIESDFKETATPVQKEIHYYNTIEKALKKYPPKQ